MISVKQSIFQLTNKAVTIFDFLKRGVKKKFNMFNPIEPVAYIGYGNEEKAFISGRVLEEKGQNIPKINDSLYRNFKAVYRRFMSDKIPDAKLTIEFSGEKHEAITDEEGYFHIEMPYKHTENKLFENVQARLHEGLGKKIDKISETQIFIPSRESDYGIISDIDDTIITTHATNLFQALKLTLFNNPYTRTPFKGVSAFYRALRKGPLGLSHNPFFFVSSSPYNFYDLLVEFIKVHGIPLGPLFLQDYGIDKLKFIREQHLTHKIKAISKIMSVYPSMKFILIGDSGEKDPEIYEEAAKRFPGRILAVYIREVAGIFRSKEVKEIAERVSASGTPMILAENSLEAAVHSSFNGIIDVNELEFIRINKLQDEESPGKIKQMWHKSTS